MSRYQYKDRGVSFTFAGDGVSFFGKLDLTEIGLSASPYEKGHSVCSHLHKTESAALSCARKKRADFRTGRRLI